MVGGSVQGQSEGSAEFKAFFQNTYTRRDKVEVALQRVQRLEGCLNANLK